MVFDLISNVTGKSDQAKIAVLLIVERFAKENIFKKADIMLFINDYLEGIKEGMLFKVKKYLWPTLLQIGNYLDEN